MPESTILDSNGKPIKRAVLEQEQATPSITGVRNAWMSNSMADGLTPAKLASILSAANDGDDFDLLTLAGEMEEREPHYGSVLGTRKLAVESLPITVESASEDKKDEEIAEDIRQLTKRPEFEELISDLLDGLGKGRSTVEIVWQTGEKYKPSYKWRDPRFFMISKDEKQQLRLKDDDNEEGIELAPFKFITHIPKLRTGIVSRSGLARLVVVSYMCKSYSLSDWMSFLELFGLPIRVGRYGAGTSEDDKKILKSAVASIGSDAAAIIPDSMRIEFIERSSAANGDQVFSRIAEWLDKQISKAVLGQTATTESEAGKLGNSEEQSEVRQDILKADAKQLTRTINRDLIKPYVDLNYGIQENGYPRVVLYVKDPENLQLIVNAVKDLVPVGLKVKQSEIRDKLNLSDPEEGDELFAPVSATPQAPGNEPSANHKSCPSCGINKKAINTQKTADNIDELVMQGLEYWEEITSPIIDPLLSLAKNSKTFEEFKAGLPTLLEGGMDASALIDSLAALSFKAKGLGDAGQ